jgi:hypothetical protein
LRTDSSASLIRLHKKSATAIAFGFGAAWIGTYNKEAGSTNHSPVWVSVLRAGSTKVTPILIGTDANWGPLAIATGQNAVWALTNHDLVEIDPRTLQIIHQRNVSREQPNFLAAGAGAVWLAGGQAVTKVNPRTDRIIRTFQLGTRTRIVCGISANASSVWVSIGNRHCDTIGQ